MRKTQTRNANASYRKIRKKALEQLQDNNPPQLPGLTKNQLQNKTKITVFSIDSLIYRMLHPLKMKWNF